MKISTFFVSLLALGVLTPHPAANAAEIANSINDFTVDGTQGGDGWTDGYRNYTADGGGEDYDPVAEFLEFDPATHWRGTGWRLVAANAPWTTLNAESAHPNGSNNGDEHWAVRRWLAPATQPLAVTWHVRKDAAAGLGVSGSLHLEGVQVDTVALAGNDTVGVTRIFFINATEEDRIDLALTPVGAGGNRLDGSDGSSFWMAIDDEVNDLETQPDGTIFIASDAVDSEPDMLADAWEELYTPGDLTALDGDGVADFDADGLSDLQEQSNLTNPVEKDTDMDGLEDLAELDDHATDPNNPDSDGDGLSDGDEVNVHMTDPTDTDSDDDGYDDGREVDLGTDPNDIDYSPETALVGNSETEFSGEQGMNDWNYGYRNYTADGGAENYNPGSDFISFAGGSTGGAWDGTAQQWSGAAWDLNTAGAAPWTYLAATETHPNSGGGEHWTIRRWNATELTTVTPVAMMWHVRKNNLNGNGVSGSIHVNGNVIDANTIAGNDAAGSYRVVYANLLPGTRIDLTHTPVGTVDRGDAADSSTNWLRISTRIGANPTQPNGDPFVPATGEDTDADDLPDVWENQFFPDDLTQLNGRGGADKDVDGSPDLEEFERGTNPNDNDSDDDGLLDGVETNDGNFVDANATGTSPTDADSDGDGIDDKDEIDGTRGEATNPTVADSDDDGLSDGREFDEGTSPNDSDSDDDTYSDGEEIARGFDPLDAGSNPGTLLADSFEDFSGIQGQMGWTNGYRNLGPNPAQLDYDPTSDFTPFVGGSDMGPHVVDTQQWNNGRWDLVTAGAPWTEIGREAAHPNGTNNTDEHWPIRRWDTSELTATTPLGLTWHVRKTNLNGPGVTGSLHINGVQVDTLGVNDGTGVTRTWFANVNPGDVVDLALSPVGPDGDTTDGADGSAFWLRIDGYIPPNPLQPDGTPFAPVASGNFQITAVELDEINRTVTVTWPSAAGRIYGVDFNTDIQGTWLEDVEDFDAVGPESSYTIQLGDPLPPRLFVRVRDVTNQ